MTRTATNMEAQAWTRDANTNGARDSLDPTQDGAVWDAEEGLYVFSDGSGVYWHAPSQLWRDAL